MGWGWGNSSADRNAPGEARAPWEAGTGYWVHSYWVLGITILLSNTSHWSLLTSWHQHTTQNILGHRVLSLPLPVVFICVLRFLCWKVFTTISISCSRMRHWSVIPLKKTHCYSLFWDEQIWGRKWSVAGSVWCRKVETDRLGEQFTDWPTEPCHHLDGPTPPELPPAHLLLNLAQLHCRPWAASASAGCSLPSAHCFSPLDLLSSIIKWHFRIQKLKSHSSGWQR